MKQPIDIIKVEQTPFITNDGFQNVTVFFKSKRPYKALSGTVSVAGMKPYTVSVGSVPAGLSRKTILVKDTHDVLKPGETTCLKIELFEKSGGAQHALCVFVDDCWKRSRHWEFYLSQTMHTDLGYTDYPETLPALYTSFLDKAEEYVKNSYDRTQDGEKYKYAVESSWVLSDGYAKQKNAEEIENFVERVKRGDFIVGAGRYNNTTENFGTEETVRSPYQTNRNLHDRYGLACNNTIRMFDNPAISKSYVDVLNSAGIRYAIHSMNPDRSPYHKVRQYDLFYLQGFNPENRLLIFNGKTYADNYGFGESHRNPAGNAALAEKRLLKLIGELEKRTGRRAYPYDKFPMPLIPFGDNKPPLEKQIKIANEVNRKWQSQGFVYPKITADFPERFFEAVEKEYGSLIPVETGTEENWWNDGWGTTAYESGVNKQNGTMVPLAESAASLAGLVAAKAYPVEEIYEAHKRLSVYNEHTWGYNAYKDCDEYRQMYEWKRSNALGAKALAEKTLNDSLKALADQAGSNGYRIYVYNSLSWSRTDSVTVRLDQKVPKIFEIKNGEESLPYERSGDELTFLAKDVPPMGYKLFSIVPAERRPVFKSRSFVSGKTVETPFYKLTVDDDATVKSILDKQNGNREIVDRTADVKWNQYQYYDDFAIPFRNMGFRFSSWKWNRYQPKKEDTKIKITPFSFGVTIEATTGTFRTGSIRQTITLYDDIPRVDIDNKIVKSALPRLTAKEEAFYTFPFSVRDGYEIRYDLPIGNVAEGEQVYGTSRDWYTANKWVNVYDKSEDYSMTLALKNTSLLQFGERRTGKWSFDYQSKKPYIFSYVMNNMWQTNFQGDQPGTAEFSYSLFTGKGKSIQEINQSAWNGSAPLQAVLTVHSDEQKKADCPERSYITISRDNILLTVMKPAEANGDGMIVRFHEMAGQKTEKVLVRFIEPIVSYTETDVIENDIGEEIRSDTLTFSAKPYEIRTFRIKTDEKVPPVKNVKAVCAEVKLPRCEHYQKERVRELTNGKSTQQGTLVSWERSENALFYEVFREKNEKRYFVGATKHDCLFDPQVTKAICGDYRYCVRAVGTGRKGEFSERVQPVWGNLNEPETAQPPVLTAVPREKNRIDLFWTPVVGCVPISHYEIYRNGALIAETTDHSIVSYRDGGVTFNGRYEYKVVAVDVCGGKAVGNRVTVDHSEAFLANQDSDLAKKSKRRFLSFIP